MLGTPDYMAPEQWSDAATADIRADIYSLGCTLYYLLAGHAPFKGNSLPEIWQAHQSRTAQPLDEVRSEVPRELAAVVAKMMAKNPIQRYQTPVEVAEALLPFLKGATKGTGDTESQARSQGAGKGKVEAVRHETVVEGRSTIGGAWARLATQRVQRPSTSPRTKRKWLLLAGGVAAVLLLVFVGLWAGGLLKVKTKDGVIVLENLPADAEVLVDGATATVTWGPDGKKAEITVQPGTHHIVATKDGIKVIGEQIQIEDGGRKVVTARLEPLAQRARPDDDRPAQGKPGDLGPKALPPPVRQLREPGLLGKEMIVDLGDGLQMEFVRIPKGKFLMGSPKNEKDRGHEEEQHEVEITRDFYLGKYPVTQEQYERLMGQNPSHFSAQGGGKESVKGLDTARFPVEQVSWEDAVKFCKKLSERHVKGNGTFRLPTEAEWEYACRGGTTTPFYFGEACNGTQANCNGNYPWGAPWEKGPFLNRPSDVGAYAQVAPHPWGLCDMQGNVWQWCQDRYDKDYYFISPNKDPQGPDNGESHVQRGGAWNDYPGSCRAADRNRGVPSVRYFGLGFRVAFRLD
jgi:formylglycine-generating enzyme required for sulfatase activity